jgi:hypothetical protein
MKTLFCCVALMSLNAFADAESEAKAVAVRYLNALTGKGSEADKDLLLGGVTMNAQMFNVENSEFKKKDYEAKGEGSLSEVTRMVADIDKAGKSALTRIMGKEKAGDDMTMTELSQADANKMLGPSQAKMKALEKGHKALAYALRTQKDLYWHPKNPMRAVLKKAGSEGRYSIDVFHWTVVSKEGPRQSPREWPLRVLRFSGGGVDTGWKVMPAADWNAE